MKLKKTIGLSKYIYFCRFTFCLLVLSILARVFVSNEVATRGNEIVDLYNKKELLEEEIIALEVSDTALSSLSYVEEQAHNYGFVEITKPLLVLKPASVAALVPLDETP